MCQPVNFSGYTMICNSTGNQTVNFVPAYQLKVEKIIVAATEKEKGDNLKSLLDKHNFQTQIFNLHNVDDVIELKQQYLEQVKHCGDTICWNISGGQKCQTIAMSEAFKTRIEAGKDDVLLYLQSSPPEIYVYDKKYNLNKIPTKVDITLDDLFLLYKTEAFEKSEIYPNMDDETKKYIEVGKKALEYYENDEDFRKIFFAIMKPNPLVDDFRRGLEDNVKKLLETIKNNLNDIKIRMTGYDDFENKILYNISKAVSCNDIKEVHKYLKPLALINRLNDIYNEYWNDIKRKVIEEMIKKLDNQDYPLIKEKLSKATINKIINQIQSLGGEVSENIVDNIKRKDIKRFSIIKRNGYLFEWMVAGKVLNILENNSEIKDKISQVHVNVKTRPIRENASQDAEIDLIITTKYATAVVLEAKTYDFTGDAIEGRENQTLKKSGPYGRLIVVGPLLKKLEIKKGDTIEYPQYFDEKITHQKTNAEKHSITYACLDELESIIRRLA